MSLGCPHGRGGPGHTRAMPSSATLCKTSPAACELCVCLSPIQSVGERQCKPARCGALLGRFQCSQQRCALHRVVHYPHKRQYQRDNIGRSFRFSSSRQATEVVISPLGIQYKRKKSRHCLRPLTGGVRESFANPIVVVASC